MDAIVKLTYLFDIAVITNNVRVVMQIDSIAVVSAPLNVQRTRVLARTGMTEGESSSGFNFMLIL